MKPREIDDATLRELAERYGTPLYVYRAETIAARAGELRSARAAGRAFDVVRYAQKANPNLSILRLVRSLGCAVDAVSAGELRRALAAGFEPREVLFCSDLLEPATLELLRDHPFQMNAGSADMLESYARLEPPRRDVVLRVNPGFGHGHDPRVATGGEGSKHGIWHEDLPAVARRVRELGLEVTGLHVHVGSGSDLEHLERAREVVERAASLFERTLAMLSAGGGLPIPYRAGERRFEPARLLESWNSTRTRLEARLGRPIALEVEPGRFLVAESGVLLARVRGLKRSGAIDYVLVDAGFHNLVRPAMYGAYHEISIVGRDGDPRRPSVVAGPLCESADVFTQGKNGRIEPRELPAARPNDLVCLHDAGAYGAAMASGYNSQLLAAEVMLHNGRARLVRPRPTYDDLLAPEIDCLE